MKPIITLSFAAVFTFASLSFTFCSHNPEKKSNSPAMGFAVVELFTSEGCSSCPPADEAMIRLAKEFPENVYFLGYHVDYWDYIGWKDPFSKADYTERQKQYSETFKLNSIYTPQVVINGKKEMVGSKESQLRAAIQEELKTAPVAQIELTGKKKDESTIEVSYKLTNAGKSNLNIALVQLKAITNVKRGENKGHTLEHINIVRDLKTIVINKEANATTDFNIPSGLSLKDIKLIAFVQDKASLKITGAVAALIE